VTAVLLVEDEPDTRELLGKALARAGYDCRVAATRDEAIALACATGPGAPDVVVTDVVLGRDERGGLSVLSAVRERGLRTPVVIITAFADVEMVKIALNAGATHLLEKPFRAPELLAVLQRVLEGPGTSSGIAAIEEVMSRARLTAKERAVAVHLLEGRTSSEIALLEGNSPKTIRQHVSQIYAKCGVASRGEFFRLAYAR
jgi:DNA-binding NarL/FixJ family response regulator